MFNRKQLFLQHFLQQMTVNNLPVGRSVDETIRLTPPKRINLEEAIGYVGEDELIEVTPKAIRLRKAELASGMRRRATRRSSTAD